MAVEVYADVMCPFTHIGLARFVEERAQRDRPDVLLRVHAWPLEVVNDKPHDPEFIGEEVDQIRALMDGDYFDGFDRTRSPSSTISPMALAAAAYSVGDGVGEAVSLELRDLLFRKGVDVSNTEVLSELAQRHSVSFDPGDQESHRAVVMADRERGREQGVIGSPHFFTAHGDFFCPALDVGRDDQGNLRVEADPASFEAFLSACLDTTG